MALEFVTTYDPKSIVVTAGGIPLVMFADDTKIELEHPSAEFDEQVLCGGGTVLVATNDSRIHAKIHLDQTSPSNDVLNGFWTMWKTTRKGFPLVVKDTMGTTTIMTAQAFIRKVTPLKYGKKSEGRTWELTLLNSTETIGGNIPTV